MRGRTVILDQQLEGLDGQRVLVDLEAIDEPAMAAPEAAEAWRAWVQRGPDGPIRSLAGGRDEPSEHALDPGRFGIVVGPAGPEDDDQ